MLQRWTAPKAHEGSDIRSLVENLVTDLLTTLNAPEFPAANVLLQVIITLCNVANRRFVNLAYV